MSFFPASKPPLLKNYIYKLKGWMDFNLWMAIFHNIALLLITEQRRKIRFDTSMKRSLSKLSMRVSTFFFKYGFFIVFYFNIDLLCIINIDSFMDFFFLYSKCVSLLIFYFLIAECCAGLSK